MEYLPGLQFAFMLMMEALLQSVSTMHLLMTFRMTLTLLLNTLHKLVQESVQEL